MCRVYKRGCIIEYPGKGDPLMKSTVFEEHTDGLAIDRVIRDYEFTMTTKHFHTECEIYYLLKGERYYFIDKQTYLVKQGSLVFIDRRQIHKTSMAGQSYHDRILLEIDGEKIAPFTRLLGLDFYHFFEAHYGVLELDAGQQRYVEELLASIVAEIREKKVNYEAMVKMQVASLLIYSLRCLKNQTFAPKGEEAHTAKHRKVHEVADYIINNSGGSKSLEDLAKRFYVSKCYLSRIFKEVTGSTVNEFINIQKIKQAQRLLSDTDHNITEISEMLGYESITYFEKVFKKYTETSPLKYRKRQRTGR